MRIENIQIHNFLGFPATYHIKLGSPGRNLLVYGENGSGKSSLFRALKCFFEAAESHTGIASHANVFATSAEPAIILDIVGFDTNGDRLADSGIFEWSTTSSPFGQPLIQQANKTKGCLDYRALLETHYVHRDKQRVEIFSLLIRTVLPYVENPISGVAFGAELQAIKADMSKPMRGSMKTSYQARLTAFNQGFSATVEALATRANELLRRFFPDVEMHLTVQGTLELVGVGQDKSLRTPKVFTSATFCDRQTRLDLHQFLNEARLSALAISLYLASLLITPASKLRVLVLDDLLIGLDMSNRTAVLDILREEFHSWQVICLTYDRVWYETVRISTLEGKEWWYAELYEEMSLDGIPTPLWRGHSETWSDHLLRARQHLAEHDDRAAAVYARAAFEAFLKKYCNKHGVAVQYKMNPADMTTEMFWTAIKKALSPTDIATLQKQFRDVEMYRKIVLNPLSHEHPTTVTTAEIQGAINAIDELDRVLR